MHNTKDGISWHDYTAKLCQASHLLGVLWYLMTPCQSCHSSLLRFTPAVVSVMIFSEKCHMLTAHLHCAMCRLALRQCVCLGLCSLRLVVIDIGTSCPNHYEEAPMTTIGLQPLLPHPASGAHPSRKSSVAVSPGNLQRPMSLRWCSPGRGSAGALLASGCPATRCKT